MKVENSRSKRTLSDFLSGSLRIGSRTDLDEFLAEPGPAERVRSAPYQDVFLAIKAVGLADSRELLLLASSEQRRGFIDLDCWRKDSFHMASFMEWMAAYMQCGPEEAAAAARAVDPNLLALFLRNNIRIHALEKEPSGPCWNRRRPNYWTACGVTGPSSSRGCRTRDEPAIETSAVWPMSKRLDGA